jgi:hypothetical protein
MHVVIVLTMSLLDPRSIQTKDYNIRIYGFFFKHGDSK